MDHPRLSVVLPSHNEELNVAAMAKALGEVLAPLGGFEIVFVNDASTDGTLDAIKRLAAADRRIRYVSFTRNFGHQAALRAGLAHARGDAVILMDCDFEHPVELVPDMVAQWQRGAKVVVTQRDTAPGQVSFLKRTTSNAFYRLLDSIGDIHIEPGSADFLLLDRVAVDAIAKFEGSDIFLRGLVRWLGFPLAKLTYTQGVRRAGASKFTFRHMVDFAATGIIAHSIKPLRIAIHLSLGFALLGLLLLIYSVVSFFFVQHTVAGWTSILAAMAMLGAGQFLVLGIIGEYIGRILREPRKWPVYLVAETEASAVAAPAQPAVREAVAPRAAGP